MTIKTPETIKALGLSAILATSTAPASAENVVNGVAGWDEPDLAEFYMDDVTTKFTTGEPPVSRRVYIDCDLLVKDGANRHYTTGFAIQFNAETERTKAALGPQVISLLQAWRGQLDYRGSKVKGTITHLEGAHGISRETVKYAHDTCQNQFPDHGVDIHAIGNNLEGIHPDYINR